MTTSRQDGSVTIRPPLDSRLMHGIGAPVAAALAIWRQSDRDGLEVLLLAAAATVWILLGELVAFRARVTVDHDQGVVEVTNGIRRHVVDVGEIAALCGPLMGGASIILRKGASRPSLLHRGISLPLHGREGGIRVLADELGVPIVKSFDRPE